MANFSSALPNSLSILAGNTLPALSEEDARVLRGLRAGIESAYEELIARFEHPVYNLGLRLLGNPADAADVAQEVFLKVFRSVANFREQSSLRTWIYRIAVNEVHNHRRWFARHCRLEVPFENSERADFEGSTLPPDPGPSPYDQLLDTETQALIAQALTRVNPLFRTAVVLRDVQNLSYEEIAEILQVSLGTVKSRILRGREALRRELAQQANPNLAAALA